MNARIASCVIASALFLLIMIVGSAYLYDMRDELRVKEEIIIGDKKVADGVSIDLEYRDDDLMWKTNYSIGSNVSSDTSFHYTLYKQVNYSTAPRVVMEMEHSFYGNNFFDRIKENIGSITINLSEYYEYVPMDMWVDFDSNRVYGIDNYEYVNGLFKIKIPKDAKLIIRKEYNSYSLETKGVPHVEVATPNVVIGDKIYFTIQNLNKTFYIDDRSKQIEYELTSGILAVDKTTSKMNKLTIEKIYPIETSNVSNITILGLTSVKEDNYLLLATLEESEIFFHTYDLSQNKLIHKELVGSIPENTVMLDFNLNSQDDYIIAQYKYMDKDDSEYTTIEKVGTVYKLNDKNQIDVIISNEYYSNMTKEQKEIINADPVDMIYRNNALHFLIRNYNTTGVSNNSIMILSLGQKDILYAGKIYNNMIEDFTIGDIMYRRYSSNQNISYLRDRERSLYKVEFIK